MSGYSDFSTFSARRASGFVASAEIVLDDGTSYGPYAFAGVDTYVYVFHGWRGDFENDAEWEELNGLNTDVDVFLNWSDGTRLKFRAYSCATPQSAAFVEPNELTARAGPNYTQLVGGNPKHPMHATARTSITLREPAYYQAPVPPPPPAATGKYSDLTGFTPSSAVLEVGGVSYNLTIKNIFGLSNNSNYGDFWHGQFVGNSTNAAAFTSETTGQIQMSSSDGTTLTYLLEITSNPHGKTNNLSYKNVDGITVIIQESNQTWLSPPDTEKPVITLTGDLTITVFQGSTYTEQGATWLDNLDGTGDATVSGSVDTSTIGSYTISYNYTDNQGNVATTVTRTINVVEVPDTEKPVITLTGNATITLTQGNTYTEQGAIWVDNKDGTGDANVSGAVDTSVVGTYTISYDYTDAAGNVATTVTRSINVELPWPPTLSAYSELTGFSVSDVTITTASSGSWSGAWSNLPSRGNVRFNAPTIRFPDGSWSMTIQGDATGYTGPGTNHKAITSSNQAGYIQLNSSTGDSLIYEVDLNDSLEDGISQVHSGGSNPNGTENYLGVIIVPTSVPDTEKPVITLTGNATITLTQGNTYTEQGATWVDNKDGTGDANVSGSVDTSDIGSYTISYDYTDAAGNVATTVTRTINVIEVPDTENPVITLTGDAEILVIQGSTYTEQGAIWVDNKDGTGDATVSGSVDTSAVGTYTISYDYTDAAGNVATTVTRTVNVGAPPAAFSVPDLIVNENTAVNHEVSPSGGDWTTTVTNLMSPLTLSGNYIVGTTQEVPGYKNVTVSVAQTATVTRTNSYGSTSAQLDILVLNTTEEPDRDGDGTPDSTDDFPDDPDEDTDTDGDGVGDNKDSHPDDPRFNDVDTNSILYAVGQAVKAAGQSGGGGDTEADSYTTNAFTNGVLSGQSKYTAQGGTLLETKTFTYTNGNLTQIVVKDGSDATTLTQTIAYDGDGNVSSITKDYA